MNLKTPILLISLLFQSASFAVSEAQLPELLEKEILPYYESGTSQTYKGIDDKDVHFHALRNGHKNAVIIIPGRTEPTKKYAEVVYDLKDLPLDFFLWDPRGQGYSERLLDDPQKGYVESYKDYRKDLHKFVSIELSAYENIFFVVHSMGGAIALRYSANYPKRVKGIVTSAPMMEIKTNGMPESVAYLATRGLKLIGKKKDYVPGGGPFKEPTPYSENRVTHSPNRYAMARTIDKEDPKLYMGSATNNWLLEGIKMSRKIVRQRKKVAAIPILMFQAGKDEFSKDERQQKFCKKHPLCTLKKFPEAKHEMFQETDKIRNEVISMTKSFLREQLKKTTQAGQ